MLQQDPNRRPSADQLLEHEQIAIRIQEKAQVDKYARLKRKEVELTQKLESLKPADAQIDKQLKDLIERENYL